jgi:hypothetical protein
LTGINPVLQIADANQNYSKKDLNPMRGFQIPKPFPLSRGLLALGWLLVGLLAWLYVAFYAHKYKSGLLVILALILMFLAVMGSFWVLSFSENVSTALGTDASLTCYSRREDVGIFSVVIPELKFRNIQRHVFGDDLVKSAE